LAIFRNRAKDSIETIAQTKLPAPAATVDALVARHSPAERILVFVDELLKHADPRAIRLALEYVNKLLAATHGKL